MKTTLSSISPQKSKPYRVALVGGFCSGKSLAASLFQKLSIDTFDADDIARECVHPDSPTQTLKMIVQSFGKEILRSDGTLNRKLMREIIFSDQEKRILLEDILHPIVFAALFEKERRVKSPYIIFQIPAFRKKYAQYFDHILTIDAPEHMRIARIILRDGETKEGARKMLKAQLSQKEMLSLADTVIVNNGDEKNLAQQVEAFHSFLIAQLSQEA